LASYFYCPSKVASLQPGGIRTAANANAMIDAGANRLGASAGVAIVRELGAPEFTPKANP